MKNENSMSMKVVIIEDEELSALKLQNMLLQIDRDIEVIQVIDSVKSGIDFIQNNTEIDLIFLDIQLSDGIGLHILQKTKTNIPVIFTTAFNDYALDAFKHTSIDYLLKPVAKKDLEKSIIKYKQLFQKNNNTNKDYSEIVNIILKKKSRILGIKGRSKYPIVVEDIAYFYTEDRIVWIIKKDGTKYYINKTLEELEKELNSKKFFRSNRKTIVSVSSILKMEQLKKSRLKLILNPSPHFDIIISTENAPKFKDWILNS